MIDVAWVGLSLTGRIGNKTLKILLNHFDGDTRAILSATSRDLQQIPGIGPKIAASIKSINLEALEQDLPRWQETGITIVCMTDENYPARLKNLDDAPTTLFLRGDWKHKLKKTISIIGTRSPSSDAKRIAQNLSSTLAERGYTIVSGLALGIDAIAHMGALAVPNGNTLAILGCGLDNIYPPKHQPLANAIVKRGAILSEVHPLSSTSPAQLVARNRIVTGLSDAVIIVETEIDGGAMYAARFASHQNRPIFTFESTKSGNRELIALGAKIIDTKLNNMPF